MTAHATPRDQSLVTFLAEARAWLDENAAPRPPREELAWGEGSDDMSFFSTGSPAEDRAEVDAARAWQRRKADAGYGSISWPTDHGGRGLGSAYADAFGRLESTYAVPARHEAVSISLDIEAPTVLAHGSAQQRARYLRPLRRTDELCCQLFSEPGAGSDLGALSTLARPDGDEWRITGQKVWTTGAQFADVGFVICRTDPTGPRQRALTAFLLPMDTPGVQVRPLRQATGGTSFNEVFLDEVRVPDSARMGDVGDGWAVAMTALGFERAATVSGGRRDVVGRVEMLARHLGRTGDPVVRQALADLVIRRRVRSYTRHRAAANLRSGGVPGPEGSIDKLAGTEALRALADLVSHLLGPRLVADVGEWGTYAWGELVLGVAGLRIAGGTDEIQRNTIAHRALGLPRDPR